MGFNIYIGTKNKKFHFGHSGCGWTFQFDLPEILKCAELLGVKVPKLESVMKKLNKLSESGQYCQDEGDGRLKMYVGFHLDFVRSDFNELIKKADDIDVDDSSLFEEKHSIEKRRKILMKFIGKYKTTKLGNEIRDIQVCLYGPSLITLDNFVFNLMTNFS